jgi:hypothetical protein
MLDADKASLLQAQQGAVFGVPTNPHIDERLIG